MARLEQTIRQDGTTAASQVRNNRLGGMLKLSRGFGDIEFEEYGFSHEVEVNRYRFQLKKGERAFIVVGCDGLTETALENINDIGKIVNNNKDKPLGDICEALVDGAYNEGKAEKVEGEFKLQPLGSTDNISVGIFEANQHPASITVLDGHGGIYQGVKEGFYNDNSKLAYNAGKLSHAISQEFYPTLQHHLQLVPQLDNIQQQLNVIAEGYRSLGRSTHNKDLKKLAESIDKVLASDISADKKLEKVLTVLEQAYMKEMKHFMHPFLGKRKSDQDFINRLNSGKNDFHYPRMIGLMLQQLYSNHPQVETQIAKTHIQQINQPLHKTYDKIFTHSAQNIASSPLYEPPTYKK